MQVSCHHQHHQILNGNLCLGAALTFDMHGPGSPSSPGRGLFWRPHWGAGDLRPSPLPSLPAPPTPARLCGEPVTVAAWLPWSSGGSGSSGAGRGSPLPGGPPSPGNLVPQSRHGSREGLAEGCLGETAGTRAQAARGARGQRRGQPGISCRGRAGFVPGGAGARGAGAGWEGTGSGAAGREGVTREPGESGEALCGRPTSCDDHQGSPLSREGGGRVCPGGSPSAPPPAAPQ